MPPSTADSILVDFTVYEMRKSLEASGKSGWHGPNCTSEELLSRALKNLEKGALIDTINLCAMVLARRELFDEEEPPMNK